MGVRRSATDTVLLLLFLVLATRLTADPAERLRRELGGKHPHLRRELDHFFRMQCATADLRAMADRLGESAVLAAVDVGDYSALFLSGANGAEQVTRALRDLGRSGPWHAYWQRPDSRTRRLLLRNPLKFARFLDILEALEARPDKVLVKDLLSREPVILMVLHRLPAVGRLSPDTRLRLMPFLLGLDYSAAPRRFDDLNGLIERRAPVLVELLEHGLGGPGAVITFWAIPDLFSDPERRLNTWHALALQGAFVRRLKRTGDPADWPAKVRRLRELYEHESLQLPNATLLQMFAANPGGDLLEALYAAKHHGAKPGLAVLERLLAFCARHSVPVLPLKILNATQDPAERGALAAVATHERFFTEPGPEAGAPRRHLGVVAVFQFAERPEFRRLLVRHGVRLVDYLYKGGEPERALAVAARTDLADFDWDESWLKAALRRTPGGRVANLGVKLCKGYPVETREILFAGIDVVRIGIAIATAGGSEASGQAVAEAAGEEGVMRFFEQLAEASKEFLQEYYGAGDVAVVKAMEGIVNKVEARRDERTKGARSEAIRNVLERMAEDGVLQRHLAAMARFSAAAFDVPYLPPEKRSAAWLDGRGVDTLRLPSGYDELIAAVKSNDGAVLLVTLGRQ